MNRNRGCGFFAVPIGILIFLGAFAVIWFNEGRVDLSTIADDSIPLTGSQLDPANNGELVAVSDLFETSQLLGDPPYLDPQPFITLQREVEMYSWRESCDSENDSCDYTRVWADSPDSISNSQYANPSMREVSTSFEVELARIGQFTINPSEVIFRQNEDLVLTDGMVPPGTQVFENQIYIGEGTAQEPRIGDIRIGYNGFKADQFGTVFGQQSGEQIVTYAHNDGTLILRGFALDRQQGIAALRTEFLAALWGTRILGLFMFWGGLMLAISPIRQMLSFIPVLGRLGNAALAAATFAIALAIWLVTLLIAIIFHNLIALIVALLLAAGVGYYFWSRREKDKTSEFT